MKSPERSSRSVSVRGEKNRSIRVAVAVSLGTFHPIALRFVGRLDLLT